MSQGHRQVTSQTFKKLQGKGRSHHSTTTKSRSKVGHITVFLRQVKVKVKSYSSDKVESRSCHSTARNSRLRQGHYYNQLEVKCGLHHSFTKQLKVERRSCHSTVRNSGLKVYVTNIFSEKLNDKGCSTPLLH